MKWKTYNLEIARSDTREVERVDGGEEEERGEDEGDGCACHHLLLHCCFCCVEVRENKKEGRERMNDAEINMIEREKKKKKNQ